MFQKHKRFRCFIYYITLPKRFQVSEKIKIPLTNLRPSVIIQYANEGIAQLVEHLLDVQGVIGSSPIILTN